MTDEINNATGAVEFIAFHKPALEDGDYVIKVTHQVAAPKITTQAAPFTATLNFAVLGPRFSLDPQLIGAVFPPEGSLGDHSNVLPHVILNRSTLPWERDPDIGDAPAGSPAPWLALLLFTDDENQTITTETIALADLKKGDGSFPPIIRPKDTHPADGPYYVMESGDHDDDKLTVIELDKTLFDKVRPTRAELVLQAHVRLTADSPGKQDGTKTAVIIGNRLPQNGGNSIAYLVSVEGRYQGDEFLMPATGDKVRLVSLKSWRFSCVDQRQSFKGLLLHLNRPLLFNIHDDGISASLDKNSVNPALREAFTQSKYPLGDSVIVESDSQGGYTLSSGTDYYAITKERDRLHAYHQDRDNSGTLRLPAAAAEDYLKMGCVPLTHATRQGNRTISWYHGPLIPGQLMINEGIALPVRTADELVRYNPDYGMFDVSYAASWELGRLLALQSKSFSVALFQWKRAHARCLKEDEKAVVHLPFDGPAPALELPDAVRSWLKCLAQLDGVPFHYLVPDERLLPPESIRFFQIDQEWMECLIDGAFSIGRVLSSDHSIDQAHKKEHLDGHYVRQVSGFLLRSDVVAGWPGLLVDGYDHALAITETADAPNIALPLLRKAQLSPNVMICLFEGLVQTVDIHLKPETLHFGVDNPDDDPGQYFKTLRGGAPTATVDIPWKGDNLCRVIDITRLAKGLVPKANGQPPPSAAEFAWQMIEGVEKVRFSQAEKSSGNARIA